jgi:hypothetical protein
MHCTLIRHDDDLVGGSTTYVLYLEYLGGLVPILKGKRASRLKPEFVIYDPQAEDSVILNDYDNKKIDNSSSRKQHEKGNQSRGTSSDTKITSDDEREEDQRKRVKSYAGDLKHRVSQSLANSPIFQRKKQGSHSSQSNLHLQRKQQQQQQQSHLHQQDLSTTTSLTSDGEDDISICPDVSSSKITVSSSAPSSPGLSKKTPFTPLLNLNRKLLMSSASNKKNNSSYNSSNHLYWSARNKNMTSGSESESEQGSSSSQAHAESLVMRDEYGHVYSLPSPLMRRKCRRKRRSPTGSDATSNNNGHETTGTGMLSRVQNPRNNNNNNHRDRNNGDVAMNGNDNDAESNAAVQNDDNNANNNNSLQSRHRSSSSQSIAEVLKPESTYLDEMPETEKLVLVTSNIWGTKFKILGLSNWLPSTLGSLAYRTSVLHLQPRQMTLHIKELGAEKNSTRVTRRTSYSPGNNMSHGSAPHPPVMFESSIPVNQRMTTQGMVLSRGATSHAMTTLNKSSMSNVIIESIRNSSGYSSSSTECSSSTSAYIPVIAPMTPVKRRMMTTASPPMTLNTTDHQQKNDALFKEQRETSSMIHSSCPSYTYRIHSSSMVTHRDDDDDLPRQREEGLHLIPPMQTTLSTLIAQTSSLSPDTSSPLEIQTGYQDLEHNPFHEAYLHLCQDLSSPKAAQFQDHEENDDQQKMRNNFPRASQDTMISSSSSRENNNHTFITHHPRINTSKEDVTQEDKNMQRNSHTSGLSHSSSIHSSNPSAFKVVSNSHVDQFISNRSTATAAKQQFNHPMIMSCSLRHPTSHHELNYPLSSTFTHSDTHENFTITQMMPRRISILRRNTRVEEDEDMTSDEMIAQIARELAIEYTSNVSNMSPEFHGKTSHTKHDSMKIYANKNVGYQDETRQQPTIISCSSRDEKIIFHRDNKKIVKQPSRDNGNHLPEHNNVNRNNNESQAEYDSTNDSLQHHNHRHALRLHHHVHESSSSKECNTRQRGGYQLVDDDEESHEEAVHEHRHRIRNHSLPFTSLEERRSSRETSIFSSPVHRPKDRSMTFSSSSNKTNQQMLLDYQTYQRSLMQLDSLINLSTSSGMGNPYLHKELNADEDGDGEEILVVTRNPISSSLDIDCRQRLHYHRNHDNQEHVSFVSSSLPRHLTSSIPRHLLQHESSAHSSETTSSQGFHPNSKQILQQQHQQQVFYRYPSLLQDPSRSPSSTKGNIMLLPNNSHGEDISHGISSYIGGNQVDRKEKEQVCTEDGNVLILLNQQKQSLSSSSSVEVNPHSMQTSFSSPFSPPSSSSTQLLLMEQSSIVSEDRRRSNISGTTTTSSSLVCGSSSESGGDSSSSSLDVFQKRTLCPVITEHQSHKRSCSVKRTSLRHAIEDEGQDLLLVSSEENHDSSAGNDCSSSSQSEDRDSLNGTLKTVNGVVIDNNVRMIPHSLPSSPRNHVRRNIPNARREFSGRSILMSPFLLRKVFRKK